MYMVRDTLNRYWASEKKKCWSQILYSSYKLHMILFMLKNPCWVSNTNVGVWSLCIKMLIQCVKLLPDMNKYHNHGVLAINTYTTISHFDRLFPKGLFVCNMLQYWTLLKYRSISSLHFHRFSNAFHNNFYTTILWHCIHLHKILLNFCPKPHHSLQMTKCLNTIQIPRHRKNATAFEQALN